MTFTPNNSSAYFAKSLFNVCFFIICAFFREFQRFTYFAESLLSVCFFIICDFFLKIVSTYDIRS